MEITTIGSDKELILRLYFSPENLRLAWERMIRSNGRDVKDFFGIEMYAANLHANLERLSEFITSGQFQPRRPFKYYEPKASKTHRTKSILYIEDALVYQAIADTIATKLYARLTENNEFVFGSVLHPEVEEGIEVLKKEDADFYFFKYYIPLYNKFLNSVNHEIENTEIKFKLETDITGFFDGIPHSKLLVTLGKLGVEPAILDMLSKCLNLYSGTRESITPGVGIPQGPAASFFFANVFLSDLDFAISQQGYTYYRYMDDVRIYEEKEDKLSDALVLIDNFLKGKALSLNTKKTSIEEIGSDRQSEMVPLLNASGFESGDYIPGLFDDKQPSITILEDVSATDQENKYLVKTLTEDELISFCKKEIQEVTDYLLEAFRNIDADSFNYRDITKDEKINKHIIHYAYRWRNANSILKNCDAPILNNRLIKIWLFCVEHFFWKANHFCWNLNMYGRNTEISERLFEIVQKFGSYEWVRYQVLSNLATAQSFSNQQLRDIFRNTKDEKSPLVRLGNYLILMRHLNPGNQLYAALKQCIKDDKEPYIKSYLASFLSRNVGNNNIDVLKFWFGI